MRRIVLGILVVLALAAAFAFRAEIGNVVAGFTGRQTAVQTSTAEPGARQGGQAGRSPTGAPNAGRAGGQLAKVQTAVAATGELPVSRNLIGWVQSEASTGLTGPQQGVVAGLALKDCSTVKKGDLIAKLDDRVATAAVDKDKAAVQRDQSALDLAKQQLSRAQALIRNQTVSQETVDQALSSEKSAEATLALDNATLASDQVVLANTEIRAPFDGQLGAFQVTLGSLVQPTGQIVTLTRMSPVRVAFAVSEGDVVLLRAAIDSGTATVSATAGGATNPVVGPVTFLDTAVDKASGTVKVAATLANDDRALWPGQSAAVSLSLGSRPNVVLVPTVAVQQGASGPLVYVVGANQQVELRPVEVAGTVGDRTGINKGLAAGEHVVVEGQINLRNGSRVTESVVGGPSVAAETAAPATRAGG